MKKYILAILTAAAMVSCTDNFEDYNTDNTGVGDDAKLLFPTLQHELFHDYQTAQNLGADAYAGYMMSPNPFSLQNNLNYGLVDGWNNNAFKGMYTFVLRNIDQMQRSGLSTSNPDLWAVALIMKVEAMHRVTEKFGPIPYSAAGTSATNIAYDNESDIYNRFFLELDTAVNNLQTFVSNPANADQKPFEPVDLFYAGDYTKWIKFANSLRLRLAMHIVKVAPEVAKREGEKALAHAGGLMEAPADDAAREVTNGTSDLFMITEQWADNRVNASIITYLVGYNDPRLPIYAAKTTAPGADDPDFSGQYIGIRIGSDMNEKARYTPFSSLNTTTTFTQTRAQHVMSAAEVWFLRAEAALRGWAGSGDAQANYEKGVQVSMQQWGADIGSYLSDNTSTQADYTDPLNDDRSIEAMSNVTIAWDNADDNERKLERIMTQKWIAMFPEGMEAWTEFRRTGYPKLFPVYINRSGGSIDTDVQIRRLPYPEAEFQTNRAAVTDAVTRLKGANTGGTRLWWDVDKGNF